MSRWRFPGNGAVHASMQVIRHRQPGMAARDPRGTATLPVIIIAALLAVPVHGRAVSDDSSRGSDHAQAERKRTGFPKTSSSS